MKMKLYSAILIGSGLLLHPACAQETAAEPAVQTDSPAQEQAAPNGAEGLRMNFRGVPLEMVLDYLSDAAGFVIVLETEVQGTVDVWSNQPLNREEAVSLLNTVLNKNGYAAIQEGRVLTIVTVDEAKKRNVPVHSGSNPANIPRTDQIVTQVIPVRYINAVQLTRDLQPLLPEKATLTANEGGNALVMTDTQANIRRLAEIVNALDTAIASISTVRVFPLEYADAKTLASVIVEVFQTPQSAGGDIRRQILNRFRGGPFGGGVRGDNNAGSGESEGRPGASRVTAVADERTNSLVVSAPEELIPTIEEVVKAVDTSVEDVTELRVFRLHNSDPQEVAELLAELFPDQSNTDSRAQVQFGGGPFGRGFGDVARRRGNNEAQQSERALKQGRVIAVADRRTSSVIVSASRDLMGQIAQMITQLDSDPARKQKVFVYSLENADVQNVEEILRGLFESDTTRTSTTSRQNNQQNPLNTRTTGNNQNNIGTGFGAGQSGAGQQPFR